MKKRFILGFSILLFLAIQVNKLNAQITIGSGANPEGGALLDLKKYDDLEAKRGGRTADQGLGLPRVKLSNLKALTMGEGDRKAEIPNTGTNWSDHIGLIVYNVNAEFDACDVTSIAPGLYVWGGTSWEAIGAITEHVDDPKRNPLTLPNAYMVTTVGTASSITFPVGKAFAVWEYWKSSEGGLKLLPSPFVGSLSAKVEWQEGGKRGLSDHIVDAPTLSTTGLDEKATITVPTTGNVGNAVISLSDDTGVRWSWHIWVTEEPATYTHSTGKQTNVWMDRNLGATSATPADDATIGLYYQWGRHTPFPGYIAFEIIMENQQILDYRTKVAVTYPKYEDVETEDGNPPVQNNFRNKNSLNFAIRNPLAFIVAGSSDWYANGFMTSQTVIDAWINRWEEKIEGVDTCGNPYSVTSITNPCPEGWKVPSFISGGGNALGDDINSPWGKENTVSTEIKNYIPNWDEGIFAVDKGLNFTDEAYHLGYYPAAAMRSSLGGYGGTISSEGFYWSASPNGHGFANRLYFHKYTLEVSNNARYYYRANGMSVRCVKE